MSDCGPDSSKVCSQGRHGSSFLFFYPVIASKYYEKKQRKIWRGGSGGNFKIFKHLPNSEGKNTLVIPLNHRKK
jgi:hypothetical protein